MKNQKTTIRIIAESAMMVAIAAVLSLFPKFKFLPYGGSITVCSSLPIILVSYRRGLKWGFLAAFAFALIQMFTGFSAAGAVSLWTTVGVIFFDYIVAFTVLGLGGIFKGRLRSTSKELALGSAFALFLRLLSHTLAGYLFYSDYAEWFFSEAGTFGASVLENISGPALYWLYSLIYNATYMLPEIVITTVVASILAKYLTKVREQL